jgi:uncharacterized membrane protein
MNDQVRPSMPEPAAPLPSVPPASTPLSRGRSVWPFVIGFVVGLVLVALDFLPLVFQPFVPLRGRLLLGLFPFVPYRPGFLLLLLVAATVAWIIVRARARPASGDALELLRQRYARGEIGQEEYETRREVLRRG